LGRVHGAVIVQGSVGGTLAAGLDRFIGTLAGAVLGAAVSVTGEFWRVPQVLLLMLAVAPVALLAAIRPSFRIAPVTAAILLLTTPSNGSPIISAVDRVIEIALGTIIGIVVSIFVLPSRARRICFERSAEMLKLLAQVLGASPAAARPREARGDRALQSASPCRVGQDRGYGRRGAPRTFDPRGRRTGPRALGAHVTATTNTCSWPFTRSLWDVSMVPPVENQRSRCNLTL
jgi:hypothetical protein